MKRISTSPRPPMWFEKTWKELSAAQKDELTRQMTRASVPWAVQQTLTYLIKPDGSVYGWQVR